MFWLCRRWSVDWFCLFSFSSNILNHLTLNRVFSPPRIECISNVTVIVKAQKDNFNFDEKLLQLLFSTLQRLNAFDCRIQWIFCQKLKNGWIWRTRPIPHLFLWPISIRFTHMFTLFWASWIVASAWHIFDEVPENFTENASNVSNESNMSSYDDDDEESTNMSNASNASLELNITANVSDNTTEASLNELNITANVSDNTTEASLNELNITANVSDNTTEEDLVENGVCVCIHFR